jgi:3-oxoisoapionate decarboxylase
MRIGVDSYSYHRLLGEIRPGEDPSGHAPFAGSEAVVAEATRLGLDVLALETVFLGAPEPATIRALNAPARLELALSHGHPEGLRFGTEDAALEELLAWIEVAAETGIGLVRTVAGGPRSRGTIPAAERVAGTVEALEVAARRAEAAGVRLCLENHADLDLVPFEAVLDALEGRVGVCLDTGNWERVGVDPVEAAGRLAARVDALHVKDTAGPWSDPVAGPRSVALGTGVLALEAILDVVLAASPGAAVLVELAHLGGAPADELALVEQGVDWLRAYARGRPRR